MKSNFLSVLLHERENNIKNGLYEYTIINMSFNTNRMEGSTLTLSDTQALYEYDTVLTGGHKMDDLLEGKNHFALFDFMLDSIDEPLTGRLIKEYHQLLKKGTSDDLNYGVGTYKTIPNIVGDQPTAQPYEVKGLMRKLIEEHSIVDVNDILKFHHQFELIHPFQDGNGRIGRMIMFRQCLTNNLTPFIIPSEKGEVYIKGLEVFLEQPTVLEDEIKVFQRKYEKLAEPFIQQYKNN